jgi:hypothetical protein
MFPFPSALLTAVAAGGAPAVSPITMVGSKVLTYTSGSAQAVSLTDLLDSGGGAATLQQNDIVVVTMCRASTSDLSAASTSPSAGQSYTLVGSDLYSDSGFDANFSVNYKFMGATPDTTVTLPGTGGGGMAVTVFAFRGVNTTTPLDVAATTASGVNTTTHDPPAITPTTAGALISVHVGGAGSALGSAAYALPGDLSSTTNEFRTKAANGSGSGASGVGTGLKKDWSSGSFDPTAWTAGLSSSWVAMTIAWRPA